MANPENVLGVNAERTPKKRQELAAAAGRASGESRRRKRAMREVLDDLLQMPLRRGELKNVECLGDLAGPNGKITPLMLNSKINVTVEQAVLLGRCCLLCRAIPRRRRSCVILQGRRFLRMSKSSLNTRTMALPMQLNAVQRMCGNNGHRWQAAQYYQTCYQVL